MARDKDWRDSKCGCCLPWTGFSNVASGKVRPCCIFDDFAKTDDGQDMFVQNISPAEILKTKYFTDIREEFLAGKMPAGCFRCKQDEAAGIRSKRQVENENIQWSVDLDKLVSPKAINIQTILNNSCNLQCRSCNGEHSSTWMKTLSKDKVLTLFPNGQVSKPTSKFWRTRGEWLKDIQILEIMGGEPFYTSRWKTIFTELIDGNLSKNIHLRMSTNCTIFDEEYVSLLEKNFKTFGLSLSLDGTGELFESMRYPAKWNEVESNAKKFYALLNPTGNKSRINITYTLSWANAAGYIEFSQWAKENLPGVPIWVNFLHGPMHLNLRNAPDRIKKYIIDKIKKHADIDKNVNDILMLLNQDRNFSESDTIAMINKYNGPNIWKLFDE